MKVCSKEEIDVEEQCENGSLTLYEQCLLKGRTPGKTPNSPKGEASGETSQSAETVRNMLVV